MLTLADQLSGIRHHRAVVLIDKRQEERGGRRRKASLVEREDTKISESKARVLAAIKTLGTPTCTEIMAETGFSDSNARRVLCRLLADKRIAIAEGPGGARRYTTDLSSGNIQYGDIPKRVLDVVAALKAIGGTGTVTQITEQSDWSRQNAKLATLRAVAMGLVDRTHDTVKAGRANAIVYRLASGNVDKK